VKWTPNLVSFDAALYSLRTVNSTPVGTPSPLFVSNKESFLSIQPPSPTLHLQQRKLFFCQSNRLHHSSSSTEKASLLSIQPPSPLFVFNRESLSFINPTTLTTLPLQQCRCAFCFHSLALCRHSYACFLRLLVLASTVRLALPLRLLRLRPAVLSTTMDSFPEEHISLSGPAT
jgi:hypothetical protein